MAKKKTEKIIEGIPNKNGEHTFYTVYTDRGYISESLYRERSFDNVDALFREHKRKYRNDEYEGKPVPSFQSWIIKRTGVKETHIPYMPLSREEQPEDDYYGGDY